MPEMLFRALLFALVSAYFTVTHADEKFVLPSDYSPSDFSHDWIKTFINSGEKGVLTALVADPSARGSPLQMAFYLDSKQSFTARVLFGNFTESDLSFTLVGLLD